MGVVSDELVEESHSSTTPAAAVGEEPEVSKERCSETVGIVEFRLGDGWSNMITVAKRL